MKLLVAYIATSGGADAVALGACLARTLKAPLDITLVIPPDSSLGYTKTGNFAEILDEQAHEWLREAAAMVPDDISVQTHICLEENAADGVIKEVERLHTTLLVVGGSGGGLLVGRHSLGSVVNDLLHSSPVPVALAPSGFRYTGGKVVREITTAIGRRPGAESVIDTASALAAAGGVPLRFLALVSRDDMPPRRTGEDEEDAVSYATELAQKAIATAHARLPENTHISSIVAHGRSIEDAVGTVEWHAGDLIMVGSSRLAAPKRLFIGSTAAKMLRVLAVPMIIVPRHENS